MLEPVVANMRFVPHVVFETRRWRRPLKMQGLFTGMILLGGRVLFLAGLRRRSDKPAPWRGPSGSVDGGAFVV